MKEYTEPARLSLSGERVAHVLSALGFASVGRFLFWSLAFGVAYTQAPLYTSNQNTKFLIGLADGGLGFLNEDWLANTLDPFPLFSFLVYATYRYLHANAFYFYNIIIFGVYLYSVAGIVAKICNIKEPRPKYLTFLVTTIALHSYVLDSLSMRIFGFELAQLHYGMAEYHIIGRIFQPSVFGVFLLLSIYAFLSKRLFSAAFLLVFAAIIHPTYLLTSAVLTVAYMLVVYREEKSAKKSLSLGLFNLTLILPVLGYLFIYFSPTSPELWSKSKAVLINIRSPHHFNPEVWLGGLVYIKLGITAVAIYLVRNTRLFPIMLLPFAVAVILTMTQVIWGNNGLAALTPWRMFIVLVPLALAIIVGHLVSRFFEKFFNPDGERYAVTTLVNFTVLLVLVLYGANTQMKRFTNYYGGETMPMMNFVREAKSFGDNFLIPVELEDFRLYTGAPILVNFKSGPYKDTEYMEWYQRFIGASDFYNARDEVACDILQRLRDRYKLTHVVVKGAHPGARCGNLAKLYKDDHYSVYRIQKEKSSLGS